MGSNSSTIITGCWWRQWITDEAISDPMEEHSDEILQEVSGMEKDEKEDGTLTERETWTLVARS
jgi:hypothetical protein